MGGDMTNVKASKSSNSNLKVPPLKIVLSSHQNNSAIVNTNSNDGEQSELHDKDYKVENDEEVCNKQQPSRKNSRSERKASDSGHPSSKTASFSSSSNSSDRSTTTSPSSESESLDSNLTIISENNLVKPKAEQKEETSQGKQEKSSRQSGKSATASNSLSGGGKKNFDGGSSAETSGDLVASSSREPTSSANQRITRSSQRAAQQNRADNTSETNGNDSNVIESQDKTVESSRKVKRRKGEPQENESETGQSAQQAITMANICPADYQRPSQNSFELYRDIRERPYKKMLQLNHIQPRMPYGFKDYLINGGPYLLDGNRLGSGLNGAPGISGVHIGYTPVNKNNTPASRLQLRMKLSNRHRKLSSHQASQQRHSAYVIPKHLDPPKSLRVSSPLYNLFQDQEKARHQMRMQHLKERERSVLTTEQEILRVYNRMAIADNRQDLHLSACTYFYYQERYHYLEETIHPKKKLGVKEVSSDQDKTNDGIDQVNISPNVPDGNETMAVDELIEGSILSEPTEKKQKSQLTSDSSTEDKKVGEQQNGEDTGATTAKVEQVITDASKLNSSDISQETKSRVTPEDQDPLKKPGSEVESGADKTDNLQGAQKTIDGPYPDKTNTSPNSEDKELKPTMSDEDLKSLNKSVFLHQLQKIDDKWAKIMGEMFIRHKNESDSLYAVQSLEWEWKAKEIGACDVRVTPCIEPDCVPRVEVSELDY